MKSIMGKIIYVICGVATVGAIIFVVPGGILLLIALYGSKVADGLTSGPWRE